MSLTLMDTGWNYNRAVNNVVVPTHLVVSDSFRTLTRAEDVNRLSDIKFEIRMKRISFRKVFEPSAIKPVGIFSTTELKLQPYKCFITMWITQFRRTAD